MARPIRIEYPGAVYHITARGNERKSIYANDADRRCFITLLEQTVKRFNWICYSYCLMDNHYHLLIETIDPTLSKGMRHLNGVYTQRMNRVHSRVGHLFQGRFKAILVEKGSYLLELCRYIVLNPVRARLVKLPEEYPWSSYRAMIGLVPRSNLLTVEWVLSCFGDNAAKAIYNYQKFVLDGIRAKSPWEGLKGQIALGSPHFLKAIEPLFSNKKMAQEIPKIQRYLNRPNLKEIFSKEIISEKNKRDELIVKMYHEYGYTLRAIAQATYLHYTTVSGIINATESN